MLVILVLGRLSRILYGAAQDTEVQRLCETITITDTVGYDYVKIFATRGGGFLDGVIAGSMRILKGLFPIDRNTGKFKMCATSLAIGHYLPAVGFNNLCDVSESEVLSVRHNIYYVCSLSRPLLYLLTTARVPILPTTNAPKKGIGFRWTAISG